MSSPEYTGEAGETDRLCFLFAWLIDQLKEIHTSKSKSSPGAEAPSAKIDMSRGALLEILRRLLMSAIWNKQLMDSAVELAQLIGENFLMDKVRKFHLLVCSNVDVSDQTSAIQSSSALFTKQEESLRLASQKLQLFGLNYVEHKVMSSGDGEAATSGRWRIAKSWSPCPIGTLPLNTSSSSRLPTLSCDAEGHPVTAEWNCRELDSCTGKRESAAFGDSADGSSPEETRPRKSSKKMRAAEEVGSEVESAAGCLALNGASKQVGQEDLYAKSAIPILL